MKKPKKAVDWANTPQSLRKRKKVQLTLSDEARSELLRRAAEHADGTQSAVVEDLLLPPRKE